MLFRSVIGENDSGKSNAMTAMRILLDSDYYYNTKRLKESDFSDLIGDWRGHWIIISAYFDEITEEDKANEVCAEISPEQENEDLKEFIENSKDFSALKYTFTGPHGIFLPLGLTATFANKNISTLDSVWLPFGITYFSSTPWTNPIWYVSAGYNFLTNSEAIRFYVTGNSMTELFAYSATSQIEFDDCGYKQTFGNLSFLSKIPL